MKIQQKAAIHTLTLQDIVCGRGGIANNWVTNRKFRKFISQWRDEYKGLRKADKELFAAKKLRFLENEGYRFVEWSQDLERYIAVADRNQLKKKIKHTLRNQREPRAAPEETVFPINYLDALSESNIQEAPEEEPQDIADNTFAAPISFVEEEPQDNTFGALSATNFVLEAVSQDNSNESLSASNYAYEVATPQDNSADAFAGSTFAHEVTPPEVTSFAADYSDEPLNVGNDSHWFHRPPLPEAVFVGGDFDLLRPRDTDDASRLSRSSNDDLCNLDLDYITNPEMIQCVLQEDGFAVNYLD